MDTPSALDPVEVRTLGALLEKQLSTPEYYPLTLNALVAACNQSSNRNPVMALDEGRILEALESLKARGLAFQVSGAGSRTLKYGHGATERHGLALQESAVLCELLLRGAQTPGELRARCRRMYEFQDLAEVDAALEGRAEGGLAVALPRQPGTKEVRWAHLLGGEPAADLPLSPAVLPSRLEAEVAELREQLTTLRAEFDAFRAQFE